MTSPVRADESTEPTPPAAVALALCKRHRTQPLIGDEVDELVVATLKVLRTMAYTASAVGRLRSVWPDVQAGLNRLNDFLRPHLNNWNSFDVHDRERPVIE